MMNKNSKNSKNKNKCEVEVDVGGKGEMQSFVMVNEKYFGQEYTMCCRYSDNGDDTKIKNNSINSNGDGIQIRHVVVKPVLKELSGEDNINTTDK